MKKLYIIRHAKSSWKNSELDDFDRPLNKRGELNAPFMGNILKEKKVKPDLILSSPALRAKTTAEIIAKKLNYSKEIVFIKEIYEASASSLNEILIQLNDESNTVLLFGHNPEFNMLTEMYVNFDENIPTCGVVELEFDCNRWSEISAKNARLASFDYPKNYN
jgi:phosphohistidine phosphatase